MRPFIGDDFLLQSDAARELYHRYAEGEPIYDYHCHVPPLQIASNHQFADLSEMWLGGDHYKWRAMRANGVDERFCTGNASPRDKFDAWMATLPEALGNPLYHWSHLELLRYFGITELASPATADEIWARANAKLPSLRVHDILSANRVALVCTTDDPADSLETHERIRASGIRTRVYPTFRPDRALGVADPKAFNPWVERLAGAARAFLLFPRRAPGAPRRLPRVRGAALRPRDGGGARGTLQPRAGGLDLQGGARREGGRSAGGGGVRVVPHA
jgi:glucuronate isomerase